MSNLNRREFLWQASALTAAAAWAKVAPVGAWMLQPAAVAPLLVDRGFASVTKIAEGVYATIADSSKGVQAFSNGGIVVGRSGVLLVEGHHQMEGAALEIEAARMVSKAPIRGAVNTHYHFDHTFGNAAYAAQQIPIIAHERVAPMMKERYAPLKGQDKAPLLAPFEEKVKAAASDTDRQRAQSDLDLMKLIFGSIESTSLTYPTESVTPSPKRIDLGGLTAVLEAHPGHTPTDLIVRVPERNIVFTGDLLFNGLYPVCFDATMDAWRRVLDRFVGYGARARFVPGHGPVCGREGVKTMADIMDDLRAHAEKMMKAGASVDEAQKRYVVPDRFKAQVVLAWGFTVGAAIEKYYAELQPRA